MTETKPTLSIIIACYNCVDTLAETVDSIHKQELSDRFEIIMVDDASTDESPKLIKELAKTHTEIKTFFSASNQGGGATRNTAISHAKGELIFCLDSDDILPPGMLNKMIQFLKRNNLDGVVFDSARSFQYNINKFKENNFNLVGKELNLNRVFTGYAWGTGANFLYTRNAYDQIGGYPTNHNFDTQGYGIRFLAAGFKALACPDSFFYQRQFTKKFSYYERAYNSGEVSLGNYLIMIEILHLFHLSIQETVLKYDLLNNRTGEKNLLSDLVNLHQENPETFFAADHEQYLIPNGRNAYLANNTHKQSVIIFTRALNEALSGNEKEALLLYTNALEGNPEFINIAYNIFALVEKIRAGNDRIANVQNLFKSFSLVQQNQTYRPSLIKRALRKLIKVLNK